MRSELQKLASRTNGAKSHGPATPAGKRISSLNSARGSMLAKTVLIEGESPAHFAALLAELHSEFQPLPGSETALVESMAVCRWRQLRFWGMEAACISHEIRNHKEMSQDPLSSLTHAVFATRNLTDHSRLLDFLAHQESRCERQYARAHKRLFDIRSHRANKFHAVEPGFPDTDSPQATENEPPPDHAAADEAKTTNPAEPGINP